MPVLLCHNLHKGRTPRAWSLQLSPDAGWSTLPHSPLPPCGGGVTEHSTQAFFFFLILFLAALGLHCCARAFSSCGEQGLLFVEARWLLIAVASLVAEHGL